jgi:hypothetical protein
MRRILLLSLVIIFCPYISPGSAAARVITPSTPGGKYTVKCGRENQPPCTTARAKFVQKKSRKCAKNSRWAAYEGGSCWSCPSGYKFTARSVKNNKACRKGLRYSRAKMIKKLSCPANMYYTSRNGGECWECPKGFGRTGLAVTHKAACITSSLKGGAPLFFCAKGYVRAEGKCWKKGRCGGANQRACLVGERIPSCNKGLYEDFKHNRCRKPKRGETAFTAGFTSLYDFFGDGISTGCKQVLGAIPDLRLKSDLGTGAANCIVDMTSGAACMYLKSEIYKKVNVLKYAKEAAYFMEIVPNVADFTGKIDKAYDGDCAKHAVSYSKARRGGRAGGILKLDCPTHQRYHKGYCYSCPSGSQWTLHPTTGNKACVNKYAADLTRHACSVQHAVADVIGPPAKCTVEIFTSNLIFTDQPIDLRAADQAFCMASGEFLYSLVSWIKSFKKPQDKAKDLNNRLKQFAQNIKTSKFARTYGIVRKFDKTVVTANKVNKLRFCK